MNAIGALQLPPAVWIVFLVLLWPAIWAGALFAAALAGDVIRQMRKPRHLPRGGRYPDSRMTT